MMGGNPSSGLAIGSMVVGILALPGSCCCYSSVPLGIAAIIMGVIAMNKAKADPMSYGGRGMALAGIICGAIGFLLAILWLILGTGMQLANELQHR
jgi:hypothetical protein